MTLIRLSATEAIGKIRNGEITSEELIQACLERIEQVDGEIEAWAHLDPDYALDQARRLDTIRQAGGPVGPLHGIPVGIKDIFDTDSLPTENGTVLDSGRQPLDDCRVVSLLQEAGAVIMGKTVTTELAVFHPGKTRNPHNPKHTPGGSSSGSAAAVASYMVPLAIGTQTNGSIIRPGSYCGVVGFKPSHGLIPRTGVLAQSPWLDTVGVYGHSVEDVALLAENIVAHDPGDRDTRARARPPLSEIAAGEPPMPPTLAFTKTAVWDQAEDDAKEAFVEIAEFLGESCDEIELPEPFDQAHALHRSIMVGDFAKNFAGYYSHGADRLSPILKDIIEEGRGVLAMDYNRAVDWIDVLNAGLDQVFDRYDAILTQIGRAHV
jgi:Asp-tRNA(Asn)/Glu-tRNA(Gln) amidotransferase A subunit family amidase